MTGLWSFTSSLSSRRDAAVPLRTTPPGAQGRAVTEAFERWERWEQRGDELSRKGRLQAQLALAGAVVLIVLYFWRV
jgi:hypothetical protein